MKNIKQSMYGVLSAAMLVAPMMVSAAVGNGWTGGQANAVSSNLPTTTIYDLISRIFNWLLAVVGFLAVIGFVISGILYLTAAGDEDQIEKAKSAMVYSIVGVIVALVGLVVVNLVVGLFTTSTTTF